MKTPIFEIFDQIGSIFLHHHDLIDSLFLLKKISLSLSHLLPEILGSKFGLFVHQHVFNSFYAFSMVSIFSLVFDLIDPFFTGLRSF